MTASGRDVRNGPGDEGRSEPRRDVTRPIARPLELELKYRPKNLSTGERILEADTLAGLAASGPVDEASVMDRYVDTADRALARAGFAARLRTTASGQVVSLKSTSAVRRGGAHEREELEGPADALAPPHDWPTSDARSLLLELAGDEPLPELVTLRQRRRRRVLQDETTAVELSLDEVEALAGGVLVAEWIELEAELVRGDPERLLDLGGVLGREAGLVPSRASKLEAALAAVAAREHRPSSVARSAARPLLAGPTPTVVEPETGAPLDGTVAADGAVPPDAPRRPKVAKAAAETPGVDADDTLAEAGRKILRFHFARMLAREPGTRDGRDIEDLHAMRVATRRMRAAWRVFGDAYRDGPTAPLRKPLRRIARRLGAVRDLDVLIEGLERYRAELPAGERAALDPLVAAWTASRSRARDRLVRSLDSDAHGRFVKSFRAFVETDGALAARVAPAEPHHVRDTAASRLWTAYEQVRAYERGLRWADVPTLHELRIAAKWLRYGLEFLREPLGADAEDLIGPVVDLQDHLGLLHDADVSAAMARAFLGDHAGSLTALEAAATARYVASREAELARLRESVGTPWRGVARLAYRRRLARAVAAL
jgi:CHAD domain-containing protein